MEAHGGADTHLQALRGPRKEQVLWPGPMAPQGMHDGAAPEGLPPLEGICTGALPRTAACGKDTHWTSL